MTRTERIALCTKIMEGYYAERMGLQAAVLKMPINKAAFKDPWMYARYQEGYEDMCNVMKVEGASK